MKNLTAQIYNGTTPDYEAAEYARRMSGVRFATYYPGGIYGSMVGEAPIELTRRLPIKGNQRLVLKAGQKTVYEGWIDDISRNTKKAVIEATGAWGKYFKRQYINKPWADSRISRDIWKIKTDASGAELCNFDNNNRLFFIPKAVAWASDNGFAVIYTAPNGETVKRVTFSYDLQESTQAWQLELYSVTSGGTATLEWSVAASGTGSADETITAQPSIWFVFRSKAAQTPPANGTVYGKITNIVVYTETGSINLTEVAKDIRAACSDVNATEAMIGSNTLSLVPFFTQGYTSLGDVLLQACSYGDASYNQWGVYLDASDNAFSVDGKPVLVVEQKPALTSADYSVNMTELVNPIDLNLSYADICNYVIVGYLDEIDNMTRLYLTPDDDSTLKDDTSISAYGEQQRVILIETTSATLAAQIGRRYLAQYKDPYYQASAPVVISGSIRLVNGGRVPVSHVRAGKRIMVETILRPGQTSGAIAPITATEYDDETDILTIYSGQNIGR